MLQAEDGIRGFWMWLEVRRGIVRSVRMQLESVRKQLELNGVKLEVSKEALEQIAHEGYDPQFGARPVKRVIQRQILNELSKQLIAGDVNTEKPIKILVENGALKFENWLHFISDM